MDFQTPKKEPVVLDAFSELGLPILPCLYIVEVTLYSKSKCALVQGRDVHHHGKKGRDNIQVQKHRKNAFSNLLSQVGIRLINNRMSNIVFCDKQTAGPFYLYSKYLELVICPFCPSLSFPPEHLNWPFLK
ncbi:hypothetical protein J6590_073662 [Homalodisca vitripennis]|nr:hypothetical protein J6590_073662 [Homalodisca vitripennis]